MNGNLFEKIATKSVDSVPALISGTEEAALNEGEYVIPSDVVALLGKGKLSEGARLLDNFVARTRAGSTEADL